MDYWTINTFIFTFIYTLFLKIFYRFQISHRLFSTFLARFSSFLTLLFFYTHKDRSSRITSINEYAYEFLKKLPVFNTCLSIDEWGTSTCEYDHEYLWVNCPFSILIFPLWILLNGLFIFNTHFSVGSIFYGVCKCILQKYIFMYFCKIYLHVFFFFS